MNKTTALIVIAAFALGCAAARVFVVPPARAQGIQRWEYFCFEGYGAENVTAKANQAGAQGWEMVGADSMQGYESWCFKRPK